MVLQRNKPVPVWGKATAGAPVKVIFGKQVKEGVAGADGSFQLSLDAMPADSIGQSLFVISEDTVVYKDVLVGEVWLCSGQSNMEYTMNRSGHWYNAKRSQGLDSIQVTKENNPSIRLFLVHRDLNKPGDRNKGWQRAENPWVGQFSAAGYYYAKELQSRLHVPVGMIAASMPGSAIEPWLPARSTTPKTDTSKSTEETAGKFFTGLIQPLAPYALSGFLWYQGETNCMLNQREEYTQSMLLLINSWRGLWNNSNLPFYYVQIAPYYYSGYKGKVKLNDRSLAYFRAAQDKVLTLTKNTARIITTDLVDKVEDLHPAYKWEIGKRLAWLALDRTYHIKQVSEGPRIAGVSFNNHVARVNFVNAHLGLIAHDSSKVTGFELAGADGRFYPATGIIKDNKYIQVSAAEVPRPKALRFAWKEDAQPNLYNKAGLPAEPYQTNVPEGTN
ncbi:sialate O-acetylesterase [Niastella sp. OAS944]|uniref:sialate O-acetylesterase n=1 Tax=Niastella sp. OAS944 TaxID=2664089 RepID=UPI00348397F1|nr:sialate O-acetylesterase [Chitinophagaceae bacterium OAS944]